MHKRHKAVRGAPSDGAGDSEPDGTNECPRLAGRTGGSNRPPASVVRRRAAFFEACLERAESAQGLGSQVAADLDAVDPRPEATSQEVEMVSTAEASAEANEQVAQSEGAAGQCGEGPSAFQLGESITPMGSGAVAVPYVPPLIARTRSGDSDGTDVEMASVGQADALAATIVALRRELEDKERERQQAVSAALRKAGECESLAGVVRELAASRAKLVAGKGALAEQLAEVQHEYARVVRIADLSRTVSQQNMAKAAHAVRAQKRAEEDAARSRAAVAALRERCALLRAENGALGERLQLLERLGPGAGRHESACMLEFTRYQLRETY